MADPKTALERYNDLRCPAWQRLIGYKRDGEEKAAAYLRSMPADAAEQLKAKDKGLDILQQSLQDSLLNAQELERGWAAKGEEIATVKDDLITALFERNKAEARVKELEEYVGVEMAMSDFRTAGDMREALNKQRGTLAALRGALEKQPIPGPWSSGPESGHNRVRCQSCGQWRGTGGEHESRTVAELLIADDWHLKYCRWIAHRRVLVDGAGAPEAAVIKAAVAWHTVLRTSDDIGASDEAKCALWECIEDMEKA